MMRARLPKGVSADDLWPFVAVLVPAIAVLMSTMATGDLAYQIRAGDLMASSRAVLRADVFTFTRLGQPWVDQQWGAQLILAAVYRLGGWRLIAMVRAIIVAIAVGVTYRFTARKTRDPLLAASLTFGAFLVAILLPGTFAMRPQLLAVPMFLIAEWILRARGEHPARLLWLPVVSILWANLHGSFLLLPLLVVLALIDDLQAKAPSLPWTASMAVATLIASMANPWGAGIYSYVFKLSSDPVIRTQITEWQPLAKRLGAGSAFLAAVVGAVGLFSWRRNRWPMLGEMLGLLIFTALAATSGRFLIWWSLFVPPVLGGLIEGREQTSTERTRFGPAVALLIVALLIVGLVRVAVIQPGSRLLSDAPVGIAAAAAEQVKPGDHVFDGAWASWLEHQAPAGLMLLDDRAEFFSADLWDESQMVSNAEPGWKEQLDRWQVRVVVASWLNQGPLIRALRATPGWQDVHTDANGAVFVRA